MCVRACMCVGADCSLFFPDGQSACMCPGVSTAALHNETPSAGFFMAMSMCCDVNEPSLPKTPPLIVLFDPPLILLIRSSAFRVKRYTHTSIAAPACVEKKNGTRKSKLSASVLGELHLLRWPRIFSWKTTLAPGDHYISNARANGQARTVGTMQRQQQIACRIVRCRCLFVLVWVHRLIYCMNKSRKQTEE